MREVIAVLITVVVLFTACNRSDDIDEELPEVTEPEITTTAAQSTTVTTATTAAITTAPPVTMNITCIPQL